MWCFQRASIHIIPQAPPYTLGTALGHSQPATRTPWPGALPVNRLGPSGADDRVWVTGPPAHPRVQWFTWWTQRALHTVLITVIYYNEAKSAERKGAWTKWKKLGTDFQGSLPRGVSQDALNSPARSCDNTCEMLSTRENRLSLGIQGFYQGSAT